MAYQVLARKWRPKKFADLVGQEHVVRALVNAMQQGRLHHAYLLTGTRGVGKTTIARILAKSLNCEFAEAGEPCGQCSSCTQIDSGRYVDLLEIDAASNTGIDNIREVLENAQYAPTVGQYKIYIIDEVHMLSKSAFNAMLKTLEEPPAHVKFILATTDPHKVPITVLSRCLQFVLRNLNSTQVAGHLAHVLQAEGIAYEDAALSLLGRAAMGSMRDALSLLDQVIALSAGAVHEADVRQMIGAVERHYLFDIVHAVMRQDGAQLLNLAQHMSAQAVGFDSALTELAALLQQLALLKAVPGAVADDDPERDALQALAQGLSEEQIQLYYQCAVHGKKDLPLAPDEYAGFMMTLLRLLAFTPMAAAAHGLQQEIAGSELHTPMPATFRQPDVHTAPTPVAEKKTPALEPTRPLNPTIAASSTHLADTEADPVDSLPESPARVAPASSALAGARGVVMSETVQADVEDSSEDNPPWPDADADVETAVQQAWVETGAAAVTEAGWRDDVAAQAQPVDAIIEAEEPEARLSAAEAAAHEDMFAEQVAPVPALDSAQSVVPVTATGQVVSGHVPQTQATADEAVLPPLQAASWPQIVAQLAPRLGAAQMLAQHAAWLDYDAKSGVLTLALSADSRAVANKPLLQRLAEAMTKAYATPIEIRTEAWRDGCETPHLYQQRQQQVQQQQAWDLLAQDPVADQLRTAFNGTWLPETVVQHS